MLEGAAARTDPDSHLGKYGDLDDLDGDGVADLAADEDDMEMAERGDGARPRSMLSGVGSALAAAVLSQDKGPEPDQKVRRMAFCGFLETCNGGAQGALQRCKEPPL